MNTLKRIYDVEELDDIIEELTTEGFSYDLLAGRKVIYHDGRKSPLVEWQNLIAIQKRLHCSRCGKRGTTVCLHGGMHSGAWCYAYNKRGKYLANLRDQEYVCRACLGGKS